MRKTILPAALLACLSACTAVGPNYVSPVFETPASFATPLQGTASAAHDSATFWASFNDPDLADLVAKALAANHDIRIAGANLREVRGLRSEVRGGQFPKIDVQGSVTRDRLSLSQLPGTTISQRTDTHIDTGFDAAWEPDLFGGIRRSVEAASAQVEAAQADLGAVRISVAAETARAYFELRGLQRRIGVARNNLQIQFDTLDIITKRFNVGRGTDFDVARARGLVETTRGAIPALEADLARTLYSLSVLTAQAPGTELNLSDRVGATMAAAPTFAINDPKSLLRRRPDVVAAERRVAAATATIGVSTAELFPSVTLIGSVGLTATRGSDLSRGNAVRYTVGPTLAWNVLDFGRIRSRIEQADARNEAALAAYERTVLRALEDADGALVTVYRVNEQAEAATAAAAAARTAARLASLRYRAGSTDLLDLLDAQRQVLATEDTLSQVETARVVASVALFKAMGGGWEVAQLTVVDQKRVE